MILLTDWLIIYLDRVSVAYGNRKSWGACVEFPTVATYNYVPINSSNPSPVLTRRTTHPTDMTRQQKTGNRKFRPQRTFASSSDMELSLKGAKMSRNFPSRPFLRYICVSVCQRKFHCFYALRSESCVCNFRSRERNFQSSRERVPAFQCLDSRIKGINWSQMY